MKLYSYYRSSASYRLRIALKLKGIAYDYHAVNLLQAEQRCDAYLAINPLGLVPTLILDDGARLTQSSAIIEYLEETHPEPALLPENPLARARVRSLVNAVACEIQPLCNSGVTEHLKKVMGVSDAGIGEWYERWMPRGFVAVEEMLETASTAFATGDAPGMADIFLVPQVYNARRFNLDMAPYPNITRVVDACNELPAFIEAAPEQQPDAPSS
ncbi:maleylacetoacetate isomerase [Halioglobus japonicus]|uniref:Maleylacetoacetate isomerase n=1 Tax=Halioglobus japonicus TaxID=930805 RepID=A0AAP8MGV6_9GAMM|nr:maleylacetoacetate isomerase [Halioglobus japonicus]AQA19302.1 maleylacetoacetate isomerase [Halioglobus japonicus]PLW87656.1 maleylacetoacetate isomerase [Halioglobus japonicus]GHD07273.1 maleylacetoacetate isomerase [Halioglobus japonicus]